MAAEYTRHLAEIAFWVCGVAAVLLFALGIAVSWSALNQAFPSQSQPSGAGASRHAGHRAQLSDGSGG